jgi:hypothetical protein
MSVAGESGGSLVEGATQKRKRIIRNTPKASGPTGPGKGQGDRWGTGGPSQRTGLARPDPLEDSRKP